MLQVSLFELVLRGLPEGFLFVLAAYALSRRRIHPQRYIISSLLVALFTYAIRLMNINFGVHTVLNIIVLVLLVVFINQLEWISSVKGAMTATLCMFVIEMLNVMVLQMIYGDGLTQIANDPYKKTLAGTPGIVLFAVVICLLYYLLSIRSKKNGTAETNGTTGE